MEIAKRKKKSISTGRGKGSDFMKASLCNGEKSRGKVVGNKEYGRRFPPVIDDNGCNIVQERYSVLAVYSTDDRYYPIRVPESIVPLWCRTKVVL